jgi:hypothetical protein
MLDPNYESKGLPVRFSDYKLPRTAAQLQSDLNQAWDKLRDQRRDFDAKVGALYQELRREKFKGRLLTGLLSVLIWKGCEVFLVDLLPLIRRLLGV